MLMRRGLLALVWCAAWMHGENANADSLTPWETPRDLSTFRSLLNHSPFSLPTAEESSPLSDRFAMTGIATVGGVEQIFIFDRADQSRGVLTHTPNDKNMSLVSLVREGDKPPQKATIRVGADTGIIAFLEASQQPQQPQGFPGQFPGQIRPAGMRLPPFPQQPGQVGQFPQPGILPVRPGIMNNPRIIRRLPVAMPNQPTP